MRVRAAARRIRLGILCVPLAGAVSLLGLLIAGEYVHPADDPRGFAEWVTSARFQFVFLVDALQATLAIVGMIALYACLADGRAERWALAGLVAWCASATGGVAGAGLDFVAIPAAERYLGGQQDALEGVLLAADPGGFPLLIKVSALVLGWILPLCANLFFGVAIWRSGTLPQGAAVLWVGASLLGIASLNPSTYLGAGVEALVVALDLGGSGWIAYSVWRQPLARTRRS